MAIKVKDRSMPFSGGTITEGSPRITAEVNNPQVSSPQPGQDYDVACGTDRNGVATPVSTTAEVGKAIIARPNDKAPIPSGPAVANLSKHREIVTGAAVANPAFGYRNPSQKVTK